jgi:gliding motility-associated-like protein
LSSNIFDFRFIAKDDCGIAFDSSLIANNILLEVIETNTEAQLIWSFFNNWEGGVEKYQVLKYTGDEFPERSTWNILAEEAPVVNQYNNFYEEDAFFNTNCFVIRAIESGPNRFGITDTAYSNTVCFIRTLIAYFPSALTPNSLINTFKVVGVGIDFEKSAYQIYNRWGEKIWETKNGLEEWNGVDYSGKQVPDDIYVYKATIIGLLGDIKKYRGTIQVIR